MALIRDVASWTVHVRNEPLLHRAREQLQLDKWLGNTSEARTMSVATALNLQLGTCGLPNVMGRTTPRSCLMATFHRAAAWKLHFLVAGCHAMATCTYIRS